MDPEKNPLDQLKDQQTENHAQNRKSIHDLRDITQTLADRVGRVEDLVDGRLQMFRQELQAELSPLKASIAFHNLQVSRIELSTAETAKGLARVEGTVETLGVQQASNHSENSGKLDALLERFNIYVGSVQGTRENSELKKHNIREWLKVLLASTSIGTAYELLRHWWNSWHK